MNAIPSRTLVDALRSLRTETRRGFTFLNKRLEADTWSFTALVHEAERRALVLRSLGLQRGDRLALILPEGRDFPGGARRRGRRLFVVAAIHVARLGCDRLTAPVSDARGEQS